MSKYAAAIYSTTPADWSASRWTSLPKQEPAFGVLDQFEGEAVIDSFTIQPGKAGEVATIAGRYGEARFCANSTDPAICAQLRSGASIGRPVRVEEAEPGLNGFWLI